MQSNPNAVAAGKRPKVVREALDKRDGWSKDLCLLKITCLSLLNKAISSPGI